MKNISVVNTKLTTHCKYCERKKDNSEYEKIQTNTENWRDLNKQPSDIGAILSRCIAKQYTGAGIDDKFAKMFSKLPEYVSEVQEEMQKIDASYQHFLDMRKKKLLHTVDKEDIAFLECEKFREEYEKDNTELEHNSLR